jgi:hypothetical protein
MRFVFAQEVAERRRRSREPVVLASILTIRQNIVRQNSFPAGRYSHLPVAVTTCPRHTRILRTAPRQQVLRAIACEERFSTNEQ